MTTFTKLFSTLVLVIFAVALQAQNANVIYSEDFDGGVPDGWTTADAADFGAVFTWCNDPTTGQADGCPRIWDDAINEQVPFAAETVLNGFMTMDSDLVGQIAGNHVSQLTSGLVDFTGQSEVWFGAQMHIGVFTLDASDNAILRVSTDQENWTEYTLFPGLDTGVRWSENPASPVVNISDAAAGNSVYLQFQWTGNYEYHWSIDDVVAYDGDPRFANDLQLDGFFAIAPNYLTPASQLEPISFLADVSNQGSTQQDEVVLTVGVETGGSEVFSTTLDMGTILTDTLNQNTPVAEAFTPDGPAGTVYTGTYSAASNAMDDDPSNNSQSFTFEVSDTTFSKAPEINSTITPAEGNWAAGESWQWSYGCHYHIVNGAGNYARTVTFGIDASEENTGQDVFVSLYQVVDGGDIGTITPDERIRVGATIITLDGTETFDNPITVPMTQLNGDPIELQDNTDYLAMVEFPVAGQIRFDLAANRAIDYSASDLLYAAIEMPRFGQVLGLGNDLELADFQSAGFGPSVVPVVDLSIGDMPLSSSINDPFLSDDNVVVINPNPASEVAMLGLDLAELSSNVNIAIYDAKGSLLREQNLENVQNAQVRLEIRDLTEGMYFVRVRTDAGVTTRNLVISK